MTGRVPLRFLLFVAVSLATRAALLPVPTLDIDESSYLVGSWEILAGRRLYVDFADHKPPLVYAYYALAQALFGRGMLAVRLFTVVVWVPLTALAASAFFGHDRRGLLAGFTYLVASAAFLGHDMHAVNCELLLLLPLAWALAAVRDRDRLGQPGPLLAAGMLAGLAVLFKYQAALLACAILITAVTVVPRAALRLAVFVLGAALPALLAYGYFAADGRGFAFLYWNVAHNLAYAANAPDAREALARAAAYALPFALATAPLLWAALATLPRLPRAQAVLLGSLLALAALAATLGGRFYPHYFIPLYLPLALAAAPWLETRLRTPAEAPARRLLAWAAFLLVGFTAANAYLYYARDDVYVETRPVFDRVAARLRADACFGQGPLFVWGYAPTFYERAGLPVASRFVFVDSTLVGHVSASSRDDVALVSGEHWEWLMEDLEGKRPAYVLDAAAARLSRWSVPLAAWPRLARWVEAGYEVAGHVDGVAVYRRRGCAAQDLGRTSSARR